MKALKKLPLVKMLLFVLMLSVLNGVIAFSGTHAWFTGDLEETDFSIDIQMGKIDVKYEPNTSSITNNSDIPINLRVHIVSHGSAATGELPKQIELNVTDSNNWTRSSSNKPEEKNLFIYNSIIYPDKKQISLPVSNTSIFVIVDAIQAGKGWGGGVK